MWFYATWGEPSTRNFTLVHALGGLVNILLWSTALFVGTLASVSHPSSSQQVSVSPYVLLSGETRKMNVFQETVRRPELSCCF